MFNTSFPDELIMKSRLPVDASTPDARFFSSCPNASIPTTPIVQTPDASIENSELTASADETGEKAAFSPDNSSTLATEMLIDTGVLTDTSSTVSIEHQEGGKKHKQKYLLCPCSTEKIVSLSQDFSCDEKCSGISSATVETERITEADSENFKPLSKDEESSFARKVECITAYSSIRSDDVNCNLEIPEDSNSIQVTFDEREKVDVVCQLNSSTPMEALSDRAEIQDSSNMFDTGTDYIRSNDVNMNTFLLSQTFSILSAHSFIHFRPV